MTAELVMDYLGALCLAAGALFALAAAVGLVRFPDPLSRMHAATKPAVFGLLLVLLGVALTLRDAKVITLVTFAIVMQVMTAPVSGHLVARTAHRTGQWDSEHAVVDELADDQSADRDD
jgi:multicomponent Na+:H+ antiporter subunit G